MKNVVVIVDDFSTASHLLWGAGYEVDIYDYALISTDLYRFDNYGNPNFLNSTVLDQYRLLYGFSPSGPLISLIDENLDGNFFNDDPSNPIFSYNDGFSDVYAIEMVSAPYSPHDTGSWEHGDKVAKSLFDHLDNPDDTFVIGIDFDRVANGLDSSKLFSDPDGDGITIFETLVHSALQGRHQFFSDDYNLIGYSFSFTDPNLPGMYDDLIEGGDGVDDIAGGDGSDALAADEFNNFDLDGDGLTSDTLSDIAGFNPFDDPDEIN